MKLLAAFSVGFFCGRVTGALVTEGASFRKQVRQAILAKSELGDLLRMEAEIGEEINRRVKEEVTA